MKYIRKPIKLSIILLALFVLAGCWNSNEMNDLAIVTAFGVDTAEKPDEISLIGQIINIRNIATAEKSAAGGDVFWNVEITGETVFDALRNLTFINNRKAFGHHYQILVVGKEIAEKGVIKDLEHFARDHGDRRTVWVVVADGKAKDVLDVKTELEPINGRYIAQLVEVRTATSKAVGVTFQNFLQRYISKTTSTFASIVRVIKKNGVESLELNGTAVFKKDKLVGELNGKETRGLLFVIDDIKSGIIVVEPENQGKTSLEINKSGTKVTPKITDNGVQMDIEVKLKTYYAGDTEDFFNVTKKEDRELLQLYANKVVKEEIEAAIKKAKSLNTDVFGFGDAVHRKYPKQWKGMESNWDSIFPDIKVSIKVETSIDSSFNITELP